MWYLGARCSHLSCLILVLTASADKRSANALWVGSIHFLCGSGLCLNMWIYGSWSVLWRMPPCPWSHPWLSRVWFFNVARGHQRLMASREGGGGGQPLSLEHPMGWSACSWPRWTDQGSLHQCLCRFADRWHLGQNLPLGLMMPQAVLLWTLSSSMLLLECSVPPCCLGKGLILPVPMWDRPKPLWLHILARGHAEFSIWLFQGFQWTT